jgi:hypothetical protein
MIKEIKERAERLHKQQRTKSKGSNRSSTLMALIPSVDIYICILLLIFNLKYNFLYLARPLPNKVVSRMLSFVRQDSKA